jgi:hypothetical protein
MELSKIVDIVNKIKNVNEFDFEIVENHSSGLGSILSIVCDIEFDGIKGKFQTEISGVETW